VAAAPAAVTSRPEAFEFEAAPTDILFVGKPTPLARLVLWEIQRNASLDLWILLAARNHFQREIEHFLFHQSFSINCFIRPMYPM
jgi:hypothetical protein